MALLGAAIYFGGPWAIHRVYRLGTTLKERSENKRRYLELSNSESLASEKTLPKVRQERWRLYYWFHARGWTIDEGNHEEYHPWGELYIHWKDASAG